MPPEVSEPARPETRLVAARLRAAERQVNAAAQATRRAIHDALTLLGEIAEVDSAQEAVAYDELWRALRELHRTAGRPSTRAIRDRGGGAPSHTVIAEALSGKSRASRFTVDAIVEALDGDRARFAALYDAVEDAAST